MRAVRPLRLCAPGVRLIPVRGVRRTAERGDAAREHQARRTPVDRILVVAANAGVSRHVFPVREVWRGVRREQCVSVPQPKARKLRQAVRPVDWRVDARQSVRIHEPEYVARISGESLQRDTAEQLIFVAECFDEPCLQGIAHGFQKHRYFQIVATARFDVGLWIKTEQRHRLRADPGRRDHVAGERQSGGRVDDLSWPPERVDAL